ncbi:hypothetical protein BO78DRAFT_413625 [Aspergillus sclerotiicarbonarius CBS 121057]|uniref:Uncharacterized protein n=1 Tax=Aspergillus sclerotiicarbonarius (strain CBS 121057 / IBT 28362) TaxID=1448318 RepID=A0A319ENN1_ASPSB|nr:hypothetical protein BO78DRAFT_413625 [Aspergillus sclerotiicarbonarius CBS 121057]
MSSEDLQWLESYLRHGYDPEAHGADDSASFFQSNPYFALPPSSSFTAAHNGPAGPQSYQYSNERSVRPTAPSSSSEASHRPHQAQPHHPLASTMPPSSGSHTEGSYRFAPPQGSKSFPSQSPKPPPSQEYKPRAPQLPKPVPTHQTGPPQGLISCGPLDAFTTAFSSSHADASILNPTACANVTLGCVANGSYEDVEFGPAITTTRAGSDSQFTSVTHTVRPGIKYTSYANGSSTDIKLASHSVVCLSSTVKLSPFASPTCANNEFGFATYNAADKCRQGWRRARS